MRIESKCNKNKIYRNIFFSFILILPLFNIIMYFFPISMDIQKIINIFLISINFFILLLYTIGLYQHKQIIEEFSGYNFIFGQHYIPNYYSEYIGFKEYHDIDYEIQQLGLKTNIIQKIYSLYPELIGLELYFYLVNIHPKLQINPYNKIILILSHRFIDIPFVRREIPYKTYKFFSIVTKMNLSYIMKIMYRKKGQLLEDDIFLPVYIDIKNED